MRAGKLDRRLTIQRLSENQRDQFNKPVQVWIDLCTVWAQQRPNRGSERFADGQVSGTAVMTFHIRYLADISMRDRLIYEGVSYEIVAPPREIGRRVVTEIDAVARVFD